MKFLIVGSALMATAIIPALAEFPPIEMRSYIHDTWHTGFALVLLGIAQEFKDQIPADLNKLARLALASLGAVFIAWIAALAFQDLQLLIALPLLGYMYFYSPKTSKG